MIKPKELLFGTAGIPWRCKGTTLDGIKEVKKLGLGAMELEFVRNINISKENAIHVKNVGKREDVLLTCHGQYYVNLNAQENAKLKASVARILSASRRAYECGAWSVCFHMSYFMGNDKTNVHDLTVKRVKELRKKLDDEGVKIWLRPETTGKGTQWGDLNETLKMAEEIEGVLPCIDFSHLHSRSVGGFNSYAEFKTQLQEVERVLGKTGLQNMHIHLSGINYGPKGERNHLNLKESDMNYKDLLKVLKEFKVKGALICESPNIEEDALLLKKTYKKI
jgi:deoxyribonuclease IV